MYVKKLPYFCVTFTAFKEKVAFTSIAQYQYHFIVFIKNP